MQIIQNDNIPEKDQIVFANIVDPYVLLLFDSGNVNLLKIEDDKSRLDFHSPPSQINVIITFLSRILKKFSIILLFFFFFL